MTVDQLNKEMNTEISSLSEGEFGEVIIEEKQMWDVPTPDTFLNPQPDVMDELPPDIINTGCGYRFLLGIYISMNSPGQVILFGENLKLFYWSLIRYIIIPHTPYLSKFDMLAAWQVVLMKTREHERFHHYSDVMRMIFNTCLDSNIEEALAVASSRFTIQGERAKWQSQIGRMSGPVYNLLMQHAFEYTSAGYRDWKSYSDEIMFKPALIKYMNPGSYLKLQGNRVDMETLIFRMVNQVGDSGFVERVL